MTYDLLETSTAEGRPLFLYRFAEGSEIWRFTSRATDWVVPGGTLADEPDDTTWTASALSHGNVIQSGDPRRVDLGLTFPLSDAFARRYLGPRGSAITTLTIFRGHEQVPDELVAHWKGRIVSARVEGVRITLQAESLFTAMRRQGVRARYQRLCRNVLYAGGCGLDIADFLVSGTATARSGLQITVPEAAEQPDGWYRGGVLRHAGVPGFIIGHVGTTLTLAGRMPGLETEIDDPGVTANVEIAPGCDLRRDTCTGRFGNLLNFGGFPDIPGRNPFGGSSII
ncbi:phage BR0599 family protein [Seohaeicola saemankumensis]|nr:phage BR0599 family protein [Seohaeicola saemankumensis]MCA0871383.1 phage BR0599 family protein [Seohaeicola saemankumensis]